MAGIDLYNNDISNTVKTQCLTQLRILNEFMDRAESLSHQEIEFLKENFRQLIGIVPTRVFRINSFSQPFERLVINEDVLGENKRLNNLSQLRYPPLTIADKIDYNRASLKGKCVFYAGSMGMLTITIEVKPKRGQLITSSKWTFNRKRPLKMVVVCQDAELAMSNPDELLDGYNEYIGCLSAMQPNNRAVVEEAYAFMVKAFIRPVNPENRQGYIMSALISNLFLNDAEEPVDAIYYPSVPNRGSAMNIAIKPEAVDELFDMTEAIESVVSVDPAQGAGGWLNICTGHCKEYDKESLGLRWINTPFPAGHEVYDLIKEFNIKLE